MRSNVLFICLIGITIISASANSENSTSNQQNDEPQLVTYTGYLAGGTIAIGIGTILALFITNHTHTKQIRISALMNVYDSLSDEERRNSRRVSYDAKKEYDKTGKIEVFRSSAYYKDVSSTVSHFNKIGVLVKKKIVSEKDFFDLHADTVLLTWGALKAHVCNEQETKHPTTFYMDHFVWLGKKAEAYWQKYRPGEKPPVIY